MENVSSEPAMILFFFNKPAFEQRLRVMSSRPRENSSCSRLSSSSEGSYDLWLGVLASSVETSCRAGAGIATRRDRTICFAGIFRP